MCLIGTQPSEAYSREEDEDEEVETEEEGFARPHHCNPESVSLRPLHGINAKNRTVVKRNMSDIII